MTGYQLEAVSRSSAMQTVRGDVIYMDETMAQAALDTPTHQEDGYMEWHLVEVDVRMERV